MGKITYRKVDPQVYKESVRVRLKGHEKQVNYVYVDVAGVPTIGTGVALVVQGKEGKWVVDPVATKSVEKATGVPLSTRQQSTLQKAADNMNTAQGQQQRRDANVALFYKDGIPTGPLQREADARSNNPQAGTFGVNLDKDGKQASQIDSDAIQVRERLFDRTLQNAGIEPPPPSMEREAMISIYYNQPSVFIDPNVQAALKNGDRDALIQAINNIPMQNPQAMGRRTSDAASIGSSIDPEVQKSVNQPPQPEGTQPQPVEVSQPGNPQPQVISDTGQGSGSFLDKVGSTLEDILNFLRSGGQSKENEGDFGATVLSVPSDAAPVLQKEPELPPQPKEPGISLWDIFFRRSDELPDGNSGLSDNQEMRKFVQGKPLYGNGEVKVAGYSRSTGQVKAHTRTKADGDPTNNLSYRKK